MAFIRRSWLGNSIDEATIEMPKTSAAITSGNVLAWTRASQALAEASATTDNHGSNCYFGVARSTQTAADSVVQVVPFQQNQIFEVDTANNTAAGQVGQRCNLSAAGTLDNDGNDGTASTDIFEIIKLVGSASNRKVLVRVVAPAGQAVA